MLNFEGNSLIFPFYNILVYSTPNLLHFGKYPLPSLIKTLGLFDTLDYYDMDISIYLRMEYASLNTHVSHFFLMGSSLGSKLQENYSM